MTDNEWEVKEPEWPDARNVSAEDIVNAVAALAEAAVRITAEPEIVAKQFAEALAGLGTMFSDLVDKLASVVEGIKPPEPKKPKRPRRDLVRHGRAAPPRTPEHIRRAKVCRKMARSRL